MPSLNALGEFKFSFSNIGNEKTDLDSKNIPYPDLPLPTTEATPIDFPVRNPDAPPPPETGGFDFGAFLDSLPADDIPPATIDDIPSAQETQTESDFNMDDFLGSINMNEVEQPPSDEPATEDLLSGFDIGSAETPVAEEPATEDLLSGFDMGSAETPVAEEPAAEEPAFDTPAFKEPPEQGIDLGGEGIDLGGETIDFGGESPAGADASADAGQDSADSGFSFDLPDGGFDAGSFDLSGDASGNADLGGFDAGEPPADGGFDAGGFDLGGDASGNADLGGFDAGEPPADGGFDAGGFDLGGDASGNADFGGFDTGEPPADGGFDAGGFDLGGDASGGADFGGFDTGEPPADGGFDAGGFDLGGDASGGADFGGFDAGEPPAAPIDLGNLGSDFASESIELESESGFEMSTPDGEMDFSGDSSFGSSDFSLDGLDELFEKTKTTPIAPPPKKSLFGGLRKKKRPAVDLPEAESNIEEIQLSESDVESLMQTIASYPLNLRIACEELIAEQVILPQQLSKLLRCLINGVHVRETAALVEEITGKPVIIPKSYEKMTGAAFEAEQASFAYIFFNNFLPVFRLFLIIAAFIASIAYLGHRFVYIPLKAENMYQRGYDLIPEGEYQRANHLFDEAFKIHKKKKWFYLYAEAFRDQRRYMLAEEKYNKLLENYPRDKKGVLDYANLNTYFLLNYERANNLLQKHLLDFSPNDYDGLLAAGDNFLLWADSDPERFYDKYEDARFHYARLMELNGWQTHIVERMLKYFIRTDNLQRVLELRHWFEGNKKRILYPSAKAELAGYLLDKQMEEIKGVPDPYLEGIQSVRNMLLEAVAESSPQIAGKNVREPNIPEPHYHLARYYNILNNAYEERLTLENAIRAFNLMESAPVKEGGGETVRRRQYRVDTHFRYSNLLANAREFIPAENEIVESIKLYEDFLDRNLIRATATLPFSRIPQLGQIYAAKGDIEYFVKPSNTEVAIADYEKAESYGYAPPEIQYRIGSAYYQLEDWSKALEYLFKSSADLPLNRRILYALGNAAYRRNDYFAAQGYYTRLLDVLSHQHSRLPVLLPNNNPQFLELGERMMLVNNNLGVVYEALADQTGNREYRAKALFYYSESANAWDSITRNPETMTRMSLLDTPGAPNINLGYLNAHNALRPSSNYFPQVFPRIDKDVLEPSRWEELVGARSLR